MLQFPFSPLPTMHPAQPLCGLPGSMCSTTASTVSLCAVQHDRIHGGTHRRQIAVGQYSNAPFALLLLRRKPSSSFDRLPDGIAIRPAGGGDDLRNPREEGNLQPAFGKDNRPWSASLDTTFSALGDAMLKGSQARAHDGGLAATRRRGGGGPRYYGVRIRPMGAVLAVEQHPAGGQSRTNPAPAAPASRPRRRGARRRARRRSANRPELPGTRCRGNSNWRRRDKRLAALPCQRRGSSMVNDSSLRPRDQ